jgi:putative ABC transport system permease protein
MKLKDIVFKANRNIFLSKSRSILTILSIIVGSTTLTFAIGAGFGVRDIVDRQLETQRNNDVIQIFPKPEVDEDESEEQVSAVPVYEEAEDRAANLLDRLNRSEVFISEEEVAQVRERSEVENVYPAYDAQFLYAEVREQKFDPFFTIRYPSFELEMVAGEQDIANDEVILTEEFAEQFSVEPEELVGENVSLAFPRINDEGEREISKKDFTVIGVKASGFADAGASVYTTYEVSKEIALSQTDEELNEYQVVVLELQNGLSDEEREALRVSLEEDYTVFDIAQAQDVASQVVTYLTIGMAGFAGIVLLAAIFGVANTMLMSVFERTRQIGLMKALGMSNGKVFLLFAIEGAMIGFWGAVGGILLAVGTSRLVINPFLARFFAEREVEVPLQLVFPSNWLISIIVLLMIISFLAAVLPSRKAAKLSPISALRYE